MKTQVLLAVLACLAVSGNAAAVEPIQLKTAEISQVVVVETAEVNSPTLVEFKPIILGESNENVHAVAAQTTAIGARNFILVVGVHGIGQSPWISFSFGRTGIPNIVQHQDFFYEGSANRPIRAVRVAEVGNSQRATAQIISGGINTPDVGIRVISALGSGFDIRIELYDY